MLLVCDTVVQHIIHYCVTISDSDLYSRKNTKVQQKQISLDLSVVSGAAKSVVCSWQTTWLVNFTHFIQGRGYFIEILMPPGTFHPDPSTF